MKATYYGAWKVGRVEGHLEQHNRQNTGHEYYDGIVTTPLGHVWVQYADAENTVLRFIHAGRAHYVSLSRGYTRRGLAMLAGRFAKAVVAGKEWR